VLADLIPGHVPDDRRLVDLLAVVVGVPQEDEPVLAPAGPVPRVAADPVELRLINFLIDDNIIAMFILDRTAFVVFLLEPTAMDVDDRHSIHPDESLWVPQSGRSQVRGDIVPRHQGRLLL